MDSQLYIPDGAAPNWWESPAIFVTAPDATSAFAPALDPVAGQSYSIWAQVFNNGQTPLQEPRVNFYSAPGATQVTFASATMIGGGESPGTLDPGGFTYIQCLENWTPVSSGHFCLIALAYDPSDETGFQAIFQSGIFDPQNNPEVAQRNLNILPGVGFHHVKMLVSALPEIDKDVVLEVHAGGVLDVVCLNRLGLRGLRPGLAEHVEVSISNESHTGADQLPSAARFLPLKVRRGTTSPIHATIRAPRLAAHEYQVVRITERMGDRIIGGIGYVVISDAKAR
jgi:hypothetical protein